MVLNETLRRHCRLHRARPLLPSSLSLCYKMCRVLSTCLSLSILLSLSAAQEEDQVMPECQKAVHWLLSQRQKDWGWGGLETTQALLAIQLSRTGDPLERELTAKQMEIDLVLQLWRHHETPALTPSRIAMYSLALSSICHDPRQFYGHDLIGSLLHHEAESDSEFALCSLAICSSGAHVRKRHLRRLLNIANSKHTVDSLGGVALALQCIVKDHRNRNLQHYLKKPILALARLQQPDGGFGSLHNTALAMQALQDENESWNRSSAISWLLAHQGPNGDFFDIPTTAEVIMALNQKDVGSVREVDCDVSPNTESDVLTAAIIPHLAILPDGKPNATLTTNKTGKNKNTKGSSSDESGMKVEEVKNEDATVTYSLWVGSNVTENYTVSITTAHNSTFYNVMQLAAEKDSHFAFSATEWPNGHYVHTLAGFKEQPMSYHYWLLYRLPSLPDSSNPPGNQLVAPTGVDDLIVQDDEHYLFWYKKL